MNLKGKKEVRSMTLEQYERERVPLEEEEAANFARFLRTEWLLFHHSPNELIGTSSRGHKLKQKREGVSKWFPDYVIIVPAERCTLWRDLLLTVELKRQKKGTLSPEQAAWLEALHNVEWIHCAVAFGSEYAIDFVKSYLK